MSTTDTNVAEVFDYRQQLRTERLGLGSASYVTGGC
jgi:hypothetical protein